MKMEILRVMFVNYVILFVVLGVGYFIIKITNRLRTRSQKNKSS